MLTIDYHSEPFVDHATSVMIHALAPIEFHNDAGRAAKVTFHCSTLDDRKGHMGELLPANRLACVLRAYGSAHAHRPRPLLFRLPIPVKIIPVPNAKTFVFEDFSGKVRERHHVQLILEPRD